MSPQDLAVAGLLTADTLRQNQPALSDEGIKRWLLTRLGWKFDRSKDRWFDPVNRDEWIASDHTLPSVCAFACALVKNPRKIACGNVVLGEEHGDPQPGERYQLGGSRFLVEKTSITTIRVVREEEA